MCDGHEQKIERLRRISEAVMYGRKTPIRWCEDTTINKLFSATLAESVYNPNVFKNDVQRNKQLLDWAEKLKDEEIAYLVCTRKVETRMNT